MIFCRFLILTLGLGFLLSSCGQKSEESAADYSSEAPAIESGASSDTMSSEESISSSAAIENGKDPNRKFIRTAELKFKAKNVAKVTYAIEDVTNHFGGFVTFTDLKSNIDYSKTTEVSADSSLETRYYTVENAMTLRVPNTKLDSTLKAIAKLVDYLDYRIIKADDVGLQVLANQLTGKRIGNSQKRLTKAIDNKGEKLWETTDAEENLLNKQQQADEAKISNLSLSDQINFSTVELKIYQRQTIGHELVPNEKSLGSYTPSFWFELTKAFTTGWDILKAIILFLVQSWGILLIGAGIFLLYKVYNNRFKAHSPSGNSKRSPVNSEIK